MIKQHLQTIKLDKFGQSLPLITVNLPATESLTVMLLSNTGSRYETPAEEGIAHFFEHMVFKGSKKFPNAKILAQSLDSVGADFNAFTSKEYTGYYVKAAARNFDLALDVLSDMILQPNLNQEDIDREKGVIIEELNMYQDMPSRHIANVFEQMVFSERGLAHDIIGRKESIRALKSENFRQLLERCYGPENLVLVIAGALDKLPNGKQSLEKKVKTAFAKLTQKRGSSVKQQVPLAAQEINKKAFSDQKFKIVYRPTEQAHFVMAWPSLSGHHADRFVLSVLSTILGGSMSSRLFSQVREERGLCYYIHSELDFYHDAGLLGCSAGVDPSRVEEALKVTKEVFMSLLSENGLAGERGAINEEELRRAKNYLQGKLLLSFEESNQVAQFFGFKQLLNNKILSLEETIERLEAVTLVDLKRVANEILVPGEMRFAMIGKFKNEDEIKNWLKI